MCVCVSTSQLWLLLLGDCILLHPLGRLPRDDRRGCTCDHFHMPPQGLPHCLWGSESHVILGCLEKKGGRICNLSIGLKNPCEVLPALSHSKNAPSLQSSVLKEMKKYMREGVEGGVQAARVNTVHLCVQ